MKNHCRIAWLVLLLVSLNSGDELKAQSRWLTGYVQTVPLLTSSSTLIKSDFLQFSRLRLTADPIFFNKNFFLNVTYEHAATFQQRILVRENSVGIVLSSSEWLNLQWTLAKEKHVLWQHRFDRFSIRWNPARAIELSAGRQVISWGTTLLLTPADPFSPFNPSDPFREFRSGVDAARIRIYPTSLSELDVVVRPTITDAGKELTALVRWLGTWKSFEISTWGGSLYGDSAWAFGSSGSIGSLALRGEAVIRNINGSIIFRGTVGIDRLLQVSEKDLMLAIEYQREELGATTPNDYLNVVLSDPSSRGELQVLGRDEVASQVSYQVHPLWNVTGLWIWNLNDRSALLSPSFTYSLSNEASILGGFFFNFGSDQVTRSKPLPSEYGTRNNAAYISLSLFFK